MDQQAAEQLETLNRQLSDLISIYRDAINHTGVSENEYWVWHTLLNIEGEFSQQDICSLWALSKQTINTIVASMVKKGYVTLKTAPGSHNRKMIHLTPSGREYGAVIVTPIANAEESAFNKVPLEVRLACSLALEKYLVALREEMSALEKHKPPEKKP